MAIILDVPPVT